MQQAGERNGKSVLYVCQLVPTRTIINGGVKCNLLRGYEVPSV
jgi:hypothetical protein